ncbi:MAG: GNAT family N-acetyltransferase [Actinobacteria bacterium]|nr:GNAT family N-acetyltransferase [Actinomycetota bacterium]
MRVRRAAEDDLSTLHELWRAFAREIPEPPHVESDSEQELEEIAEIVRGGVALLAEDDDARPLGLALARRRGSRLGRLTDLYVVPAARRQGVAAALVREVAALFRADGLEYLDLEVAASNRAARAVYAGWGFREETLGLVTGLEALSDRLAQRSEGASFGSIHIQSDDVSAVERAVRQFVPRLPGRSRGSIVSAPRNGWVALYDDVCDREPTQLRRLARELSERMGAVVLALGVEEGKVVRFSLLDRGAVVDEYLSVQEYYGPLPPGDVIALAANPTVVSRLTGAEPQAIRAAAVHGASPAELPPPAELLAGLARAMGIEGAEHGWDDAPEVPGASRIERA